jgi:thiol-disulfide isomerase/thioredoxin
MTKPKPLSKEMIVAAMARTQSNRAAARYLSVSFVHYKKWARLYKDEASGLSLWEKHKNQAGTGIPKFLTGKTNEPALIDIIEGRATPASFTPEKVKNRFIIEGYLAEECTRCKLADRRVVDYKMPLLLHFKDRNKKNYRLENLELLCYNCYFYTVGDVFENKQIQGMEDHVTIYKQEEPDWQLDEYHLERLRELGLTDEEDPDEFISRI